MLGLILGITIPIAYIYGGVFVGFRFFNLKKIKYIDSFGTHRYDSLYKNPLDGWKNCSSADSDLAVMQAIGLATVWVIYPLFKLMIKSVPIPKSQYEKDLEKAALQKRIKELESELGIK